MDQERILSKFDQLEGYLEELENIKPTSLKNYKSSIDKKRACERLIQISIETILDVCNILVSELRLGLPSDEEDIFGKMEHNNIISGEMKNKLVNMKGLRNMLVHRYGEVDDELVYENLSENLGDFDQFKEEILKYLKKKS